MHNKEWESLRINKWILFLLVNMLILFTVIGSWSIIHAETQIGVKTGDYVKYDEFLSNVQTWENMDSDIKSSMIRNNYTILPIGNDNYLITRELQRSVTMNIVETNGNLIDFKLIRGLNRTEEIKADPTVSNNDPPGHMVHIYLVPAGLSVGDIVPLPSYENNTVKIIESSVRLVNGVPRTVNHYSFIKVEDGIDNARPWTQRYKRDAYFDKETGVLIESIIGYTKTVYDENSKLSMIYNENHYFIINETNLWGTSPPYKNLLPIIFGIIIVLIAVIYYLFKKRVKGLDSIL